MGFGLGRSRDLLKIPFVRPTSEREQQVNNVHLEQWANKLPVPYVKLFTYDVPADGTVSNIVTVPVEGGIPYRVEYCFDENDLEDYDISQYILDVQFFGGFAGIPSVNAVPYNVAVVKWQRSQYYTFRASLTQTGPDRITGNGYIQLTELEEIN